MSEESTPELKQSKFRHSLQPRSGVGELPLRLTQSQNYGKKRKAKTKSPQPAIPELESPVEDESEIGISLETINEKVKIPLSKSNKSGKTSRKSSQASGGIDNQAFEGDRASAQISRSNSFANSIRSTDSGVVKEQYCCCTKWTPCERTLFATVGVLTFIIIILVIVIILVAINNSGGSSINSLPTRIFDKVK